MYYNFSQMKAAMLQNELSDYLFSGKDDVNNLRNATKELVKVKKTYKRYPISSIITDIKSGHLPGHELRRAKYNYQDVHDKAYGRYNTQERHLNRKLNKLRDMEPSPEKYDKIHGIKSAIDSRLSELSMAGDPRYAFSEK